MGLRRLEQSSLRSRRLEVVGERENGRARGRHAKGRLGTVTIEIRVGVSSGKFKYFPQNFDPCALIKELIPSMFLHKILT